MDIILASGSPRRRQLLEQIGVKDFKVISSDVDESFAPGLPPAQVVEELSRRKAAAVSAQAGPDDLVIAADTIVCLEDTILGKPADELDAFKTLTALSGVRHQVYTGVTLMRDGRAVTEHEVTTVTFRELGEEEITAYIATGEPMDKAGSYGIQGRGALLVERVEGDYFNVMGLPLCHLGRMLRGLGVDLLKQEG